MFTRSKNFLFKTDSYKVGHWPDYPKSAKTILSYFESRKGATFPYTVFYGLQSILKNGMLGQVVWQDRIHEAKIMAEEHFCGDKEVFNYEGWMDIYHRYEGRLPLEIRAVPEGTPVPTDNMMMEVFNTDERHPWLTNWAESKLTHVWYPSTVASLSRAIKEDLKEWLTNTADTLNALPFMLHDFGYRGATGDEAASIAGAGHLLNFLGTDTPVAMELAHDDYGASWQGLGYSVRATEHSIMTQRGRDGEESLVGDLIREYDTGILSLVIDSYDPYNFVDNIIPKYKDLILKRKPNKFGLAKVVLRPDSKTPQHPLPGDQVVYILKSLANTFGWTMNSKEFAVLNPAVGVLWGDGIDRVGINNICQKAQANFWSVENLVFGMGGGLLQKVNRDTQRFAFKCCARQDKDDSWHDIYKDPLDSSKASKRGRLKLVKTGGQYSTCKVDDNGFPNQLKTVFRNGYLTKEYSFADIRKAAELV